MEFLHPHGLDRSNHKGGAGLNISCDLRQLDNFDLKNLRGARRFPTVPSRHSLSTPERVAVRNGTAFAGAVGSPIGKANGVIEMADHPPTVTAIRPTTMPVGMSPGTPGPSRLDLTASFGVAGSVFAGIGAVSGFGIFGSTTREIGVYTNVGAGIFLGAGGSVGVDCSLIFGTPADFAGPFLGIGVSVTCPPPAVVGTGAVALFSPVGSGFVFMGWDIPFTVGPQWPPVVISVTATNTSILTAFKI